MERWLDTGFKLVEPKCITVSIRDYKNEGLVVKPVARRW